MRRESEGERERVLDTPALIGLQDEKKNEKRFDCVSMGAHHLERTSEQAHEWEFGKTLFVVHSTIQSLSFSLFCYIPQSLLSHTQTQLLSLSSPLSRSLSFSLVPDSVPLSLPLSLSLLFFLSFSLFRSPSPSNWMSFYCSACGYLGLVQHLKSYPEEAFFYSEMQVSLFHSPSHSTLPQLYYFLSQEFR